MFIIEQHREHEQQKNLSDIQCSNLVAAFIGVSLHHQYEAID